MLAEAGPTLGLGHLGNCLGPPTRERLPNLWGNLKKKIFAENIKKISLHFFFH